MVVVESAVAFRNFVLVLVRWGLLVVAVVCVVVASMGIMAVVLMVRVGFFGSFCGMRHVTFFMAGIMQVLLFWTLLLATSLVLTLQIRMPRSFRRSYGPWLSRFNMSIVVCGKHA